MDILVNCLWEGENSKDLGSLWIQIAHSLSISNLGSVTGNQDC